MKTSTFLKSKQFQILLPFVVILSVIYLIKSGYAFGQWLYLMIN